LFLEFDAIRRVRGFCDRDAENVAAAASRLGQNRSVGVHVDVVGVEVHGLCRGSAANKTFVQGLGHDGGAALRYLFLLLHDRGPSEQQLGRRGDRVARGRLEAVLGVRVHAAPHLEREARQRGIKLVYRDTGLHGHGRDERVLLGDVVGVAVFDDALQARDAACRPFALNDAGAGPVHRDAKRAFRQRVQLFEPADCGVQHGIVRVVRVPLESTKVPAFRERAGAVPAVGNVFGGAPDVLLDVPVGRKHARIAGLPPLPHGHARHADGPRTKRNEQKKIHNK
jgi:hypothetical protein